MPNFFRVLRDSIETIWKPCISTKYIRDKNRLNHGIFCSVPNISKTAFYEKNNVSCLGLQRCSKKSVM